VKKSACFMLLLALSAPALGAVIHVPADQPTIQAGLDAASPGDEVVVACGTYHEYDILMKSGVTLHSETGEPECVTIDAEQQGRVIISQGNDDATLIEGLSLTGGYVPYEVFYGGGMLIEDGNPRIERCLFVDNYANYKGGGIYCDTSDASFVECRFVGNVGDNGGGGGMALQSMDGSITDCVFEGNYGIDGGGLFCQRSSPLIDGCLFADNEAMVWGGAIVCLSESSPQIMNCTLVGSDANQGGGIWVAAESFPHAENCIVAFSLDGSGVWVYQGGNPQSAITLVCCDIYDNVEGNYGGAIEDQTGIDGNNSEHPFFCDAAGGDYQLAMNSPCLPENNDCGMLMGVLGQGCAGATAAPPEIAATMVLYQYAPIPFNPRTKLSFAIDAAAATDLSVFDTQGKRVRTLLDGQVLTDGLHQVEWNGRDDGGRSLPSGVYFAKLVAGGREAGITMVLLK
jgi:predicted outer membrane repeat protein